MPARYRYEAFGVRTDGGSAAAAEETEYRYAGGHPLGPGYEREPAASRLGLDYLYQRYYDPAVGKFISADPIGLGGGLNLYGYCLNDPVNAVDPSGLVRVNLFGEDYEFDGETVGGGLATGGAAVGATFSLGFWDGGNFRCRTGFGEARTLAGIGEAALSLAGVGTTFKAIKAAGGVRRWASGLVAGGRSAWRNLAGRLKKAPSRAPRPKLCFPAGTLVAVAYRDQPAEQVSVGDVILLAEADLGPSPTPGVRAYRVQGKRRDGKTISLTLREEVTGRIRTWKGAAGVDRLRVMPAPGASKTRELTGWQPGHTAYLGIEGIRPGHWVVSRNETTGRTSARQVQGATERPSPELVTIELARASGGPVVEQVTGTPEHPFYVAGRGFVALGALGIGTEVVTRAGPPLVVVSRRWVAEPRGVAVFNFEVEEDHTYFVGVTHGGAWVHNTYGEVLVLGLRGPNLATDFNAQLLNRVAAAWVKGGKVGSRPRILSHMAGFEKRLDDAGEIHFNLKGVNPIQLLDQQYDTAKEWAHLQTWSDWSKVHLYNVPPGLKIGPGANIHP